MGSPVQPNGIGWICFPSCQGYSLPTWQRPAKGCPPSSCSTSTAKVITRDDAERRRPTRTGCEGTRREPHPAPSRCHTRGGRQVRGLRGPPAGPGGLLPRSTPRNRFWTSRATTDAQAHDAQRPAVAENHAGVVPDPEPAVEGPQQGGSRSAHRRPPRLHASRARRQRDGSVQPPTTSTPVPVSASPPS